LTSNLKSFLQKTTKNFQSKYILDKRKYLQIQRLGNEFFWKRKIMKRRKRISSCPLTNFNPKVKKLKKG
jgi:hypothetical protein